MSKPSILLIPGACGLPEFYESFINAVTARGYEIRGLHLPSVCLKTETREGEAPTMYEDAAFIAKHATALADEGKDVLILTHSYGGVPGTESVKGLRVAAAGLQADSGLQETAPFDIDDKGWITLPDIEKAAATSFSHMPPEESERWARKLQKHSAASFASPLTYAGYKDVPVSYLLCEEDRAIPAAVQKAGIELIERESGRPVDVTSIKTGHCPTLSAPKETEGWIFKVLEG
ncbi:hypothetical protein UCREL1_4317 [Eutypa lata UCREL1]|uniref:AB hydrolase-1 domain-containing protein n=1 Tax=Eutypa lata (strain UCR-EL1) TaxID=1287681 RepID=M7TFG5_EUTLA|nr:hypothetical protein UCREL1_4317 [Eutypa lata UCREL1]